MTRASDALAVARGDVRDGVAAIEHFLEVLASRRVGPRVLARAVPEVQDGCGPLRAAVSSLAEAFAVELASDAAGLEAATALLAYATSRVDELSAALAGREQATMDARARLALEAIVRRIAGELGTVVRLVDLLGAPVTSETTTIDFGDALSVRRPSRRSTVTPVVAVVEVRTDELTVGDARLVLELLDFAVAKVVRAGVSAPRIVVESGPEGFPVFTVDAAPPGAKVRDPAAEDTAGRVFDVALRDELPREADVVGAAARRAGLKLSVAEDGRRVTLSL